MSRTFVSYSIGDSAAAVAIAEHLEGEGMPCWYFERDKIAGEPHLTTTEREIRLSGAFLVIISSATFDSDFVWPEILHARALNKSFFPVLVGIGRSEIESTKPRWATALGFESAVAWGETTESALSEISIGISACLARSDRRDDPPDAELTKTTLIGLNATARSGNVEALDQARTTLNGKISPVAEEAAERFFRWLSHYHHHGGYPHVGKALRTWLTADRGVTQLAEKFDLFLQMVAWVIVSPQLEQGLSCKLPSGDHQLLRMPDDDTWLRFIDSSTFDLAIAEAHERDRERQT